MIIIYILILGENIYSVEVIKKNHKNTIATLIYNFIDE